MKEKLDRCRVCGVLLQRWQDEVCVAHKPLDKRSEEGAVASDSDATGPQTEKERRLIQERESRYAAAEKRWNKT